MNDPATQMAFAGGAASPPNASPGVGAPQSVPQFGGNPTGRRRKDGFISGSPDAIAADRKKANEYQNRWRSKRRALDPPALPAKLDGSVGQVPTPADGVASVPGAPLAAPGAPIPWDPETLRPIFEQLVPACEQLDVQTITRLAAEADLPKEVLKEVEKDARWTPPTKTALLLSAPQVAAKWLNKSGISSENQGEVVLGMAIASIVASHVLLVKKLERMIADKNPPKEAAPGSPAHAN